MRVYLDAPYNEEVAVALKNLSVEEMVNISEAWITPDNPAHRALLGVERLKGLLPDIQAAHRAIFAVVPTPNDPRQAEIARLAAEEDAVHDALARGIYGYLTELALLDHNGEPLLELRDQLMPEGLSAAIHNTYRGQAGFAKLLRDRLTVDARSKLAELVVRQGTLLDRVEAWLAAGDRLGALEEERGRFAAAQGPSFGAQTVAARNGWIRAANALLAVAELSELDPGTDRVMFGPLRDAEAKAEHRSARRTPDGTPETAETPVNP